MPLFRSDILRGLCETSALSAVRLLLTAEIAEKIVQINMVSAANPWPPTPFAIIKRCPAVAIQISAEVVELADTPS
jgi:hypothetical protein